MSNIKIYLLIDNSSSEPKFHVKAQNDTEAFNKFVKEQPLSFYFSDIEIKSMVHKYRNPPGYWNPCSIKSNSDRDNEMRKEYIEKCWNSKNPTEEELKVRNDCLDYKYSIYSLDKMIEMAKEELEIADLIGPSAASELSKTITKMKNIPKKINEKLFTTLIAAGIIDQNKGVFNQFLGWGIYDFRLLGNIESFL